MDPTNRKAVNQLEALEKQSTITPMEISLTPEVASTSATVNFDMISPRETQEAPTIEERLPGIEEENESLWSDNETEVSTNE